MTTLVVLATLLACPAPTQSSAAAPNAATLYRQPPVFVENRGQWDGDFLHKTRIGAMTVLVEKNGWTFTIEEFKEKLADPEDPMGSAHRRHPEREFVRGVAVRMRFGGGARAEGVVAGTTRPGVHNYFLGNDPARWRMDVPLYEGVRLSNVWPGVDVGVRIEDGHFEYDVFVEPGADLSQVTFEVEGADGLRLAGDGELLIETPLGSVRQTVPKTWQILDDGRRETVQCDYVILGEKRFGFAVPAHDAERPLVIDPGLIYATYMGGGSDDSAVSVALDATGAATVAGYTTSTNFPTTAGAYDTSFNGGTADAFVARLNAAGNALLYATYLGGGNHDDARSVALDSTGAATVVGSTDSTNFPTTAGAYDTSYNGVADVFVVRMNVTGSVLLYATYIGGGIQEWPNSVALDATGAATVVGSTSSTNFPTTAGAYDTSHNGGVSDAFAFRLNATGNALLYATYLGGGGDSEPANGVALDATGAATIVGYTQSTNFPTTPGAYDTSYNGGVTDAFAVRLNASGNALIYATYLGGGSEDPASSVALEATGAATVVGNTISTDFPTTAGAYDTSQNGGSDAFVVRLDPTGNALLYATYLGGGATEAGFSVALDATGAATVVGWTDSTNFPTTAGAYDTSHNGFPDAYVVRLNLSGTAVLYGTYLGGGGSDVAFCGAIDATGAATVVGSTYSTNFPTTAGAYNTSSNGGNEAFVARLQLSTFSYPLMAFPDVQSVPSGATLGLQVVGPAGAPVALMFDPFAQNIPVPPYGTIGVTIPPQATADGIGLGFPGSIPMPLAIGSQGILYFSYGPIPAFLVGTTLHVQAVAAHVSFPGLAALSTHGNLALPTPACQVTFVP
jgi:hypothetical protein